MTWKLLRWMLTAAAVIIWFVIVKHAVQGSQTNQHLLVNAVIATMVAPAYVASVWLWHP